MIVRAFAILILLFIAAMVVAWVWTTFRGLWEIVNRRGQK